MRQALRQLARQRILTLELTVSSFSSYVAFLEGFARALVALETRRRPAAQVAPGVPRRVAAGGPLRAEPVHRQDAGGPRLSRRPERARRRAAGRRGVRAACTHRAGARRAARHRARRVPGRGGVQRRQRRAGAARRGAAAARRRLRVRRLRADADGADDRPAAAVLQGRPGDAARAGSRPTCSPPSSSRASSAPGSRPKPASGQAIVELGGNLPYDVQRLAHETWDDARAAGRTKVTARGSARDAAPAARRAGAGLRGRLAAADARPARGPAGRRARAGPRAAVGATRATDIGSAAPSSVQAALRRAAEARPRRARRGRPLRGGGLAPARVGGPQDLLTATHADVTLDGSPDRRRMHACPPPPTACPGWTDSASTGPSSGPGRCTTGPTRRS